MKSEERNVAQAPESMTAVVVTFSRRWSEKKVIGTLSSFIDPTFLTMPTLEGIAVTTSLFFKNPAFFSLQ
jgi:hypothetical protein